MRTPSLVFGVPIDDLTMAETLDVIDELVRDGRRQQRSHQIATVNVDFLVNALDNPELRAILQSTTVNLADGRPIVWGARIMKLPIRERVAGADLVPLIGAQAGERDWRVHFFGSAPGVAERALAKMLARTPGSSLTATSGPHIADVRRADDPVVDRIIDEINAIDPDILCVALGNPKQEYFIAAHRERLNAPVLIGIGGSLDMYVGDKKRAPMWAQRAGAEWLFRAAQEPARLGRRYARDAAVFGPRFTSYARKLGRIEPGVVTRVSIVGEEVIASTTPDAPRASGSSDAVDDRPSLDLDAVIEVLRDGANVTVDLAGGAPSRRGVTELLAVVRGARRFGRGVRVRNVAPATRHVLVDVLDLGADMVEGFDPDPS